ncbi:MAG: hypothetical protein WA002_05180 [Candidatus Acidiferrales bacterium]
MTDDVASEKKAIILGTVVLSIAAIIGWQIGSSYIANSELQYDMNYLAAQSRARVGLEPLRTEEELRNDVIDKANEHGIHLDPQQVSVQREIKPLEWTIFVAADYEARVNLLVFSFTLHFNPSSLRKYYVPH